MVRRKVTRFGVPGPSKARMAQLGEVAKRFKDWRPAREALERVRSVPTIFPQINLGTRVKGWPIQRVTVVHGPSNMGKTAFVHGLGLSFLLAGHYYAYIDAEMTSPADWIEHMMAEMAYNPAFVAQRPKSYEATVDAVRGFADTISEARVKGEIPPDTSALVAVDSLRKLVPKRLMDKIRKEGAEGKKGSVDGMSGRAAQYKAALNSAWLDELVPLLYHNNIGLVIVGREAEKQDADPFDENWKLTGGKGLEYDSSLIARIERASWTKKGEQTVGERLRVRIRKTKVAGKDDKVVDCYVHLSNGVLTPEGFDRARDVIELARACGAVTQAGSWFTSELTGESWNGESAAVEALTADPEGLGALEAEVERRLAT